MNPSRFRMAPALWALVLLVPGVAPGAGTEGWQRLGIGEESELRLEGSSTLHDWESSTSAVRIEVQLSAGAGAPTRVGALDSLLRGGGVRSLRVVVPVTSLRSGKDGLDKKLWKTLEAEDYPEITFTLRNYRFLERSEAADPLHVEGVGVLRVRDVERPDTLRVRLIPGARGVWLEGSDALRMTDFGIRPPTMMLGALRTRDAFDVHFRLLLTPPAGMATQAVPKSGHNEKGQRQ